MHAHDPGVRARAHPAGAVCVVEAPRGARDGDGGRRCNATGGVAVASCPAATPDCGSLLQAALDSCCGWRTCPHVDTLERSITTARLLHQTMAGEISPVLHLEKPPLVVSIVKQYT